VPHSSRLFRDEWAAKSRCPLRLDFNHSSNSGGVVVEAAPSVVAGRCGKSPLDRLQKLGQPVFVTDGATTRNSGLGEAS